MDARSLPSNATASNLLIRILSDVCRDDSGYQSYSEASNYSSDIQLSKVGRAEST
jgi:hypothetical protein